jgi:hypothetical protein
VFDAHLVLVTQDVLSSIMNIAKENVTASVNPQEDGELAHGFL